MTLIDKDLQDTLGALRLGPGATLTERIDAMVASSLRAGLFGSSPTLIVGGAQYHLGGEQDTSELAELARVGAADHVLDVCCFLGVPGAQLVASVGCRVSGVDRSSRCLAGARHIAELCGIGSRASYVVADASRLPFADGQFSVVWNQGSLDHEAAWLAEFGRVLASGGRLALTFAVRGQDPDSESPRWCLADVLRMVKQMGYAVWHAEDITERDIRIGWQALDKKLSAPEAAFAADLGPDWVRNAHAKFARKIETMRSGRWGNGRLVAVKP